MMIPSRTARFTRRADWAGLALRSARRAHDSSKIHHRLIELPYGRRPRRQECGCQLVEGAVGAGSQAQPGPKHSAEYPLGVRVDSGYPTFIRERRDGAGRVRPDARERVEQIGIVRNRPAMLAYDRASHVAEVGGAPIVTKALPCCAHRARCGRGKRLDGGIRPQEPAVIFRHSRDLGLLQHELGDGDVVRIPRLTPGKGSTSPAKPLQEPAFERQSVWWNFRGHTRAKLPRLTPVRKWPGS